MKTKPNKTKNTPPERIDPRFLTLVQAFEGKPGVSSGKLMSSLGLKVNGKIFAMHGRGDFVLRLPKSRVDQIVSEGKGARFDPGHGRLMKEWIVMTDENADWVELASEACAFVQQLGGK